MSTLIAPPEAAPEVLGVSDETYTGVEWHTTEASITDATGKVMFHQTPVRAPAAWSQTAVNIVASKYFHGKLGTPEREWDVEQLVRRVVETLSGWGSADGYFPDAGAAERFAGSLARLVLEQKASFNSPVWFNVGVKSETRGSGWFYDPVPTYGSSTQEGYSRVSNESKPQCSACFIISVEDRLESILDLAKTEGMLFKWGSGCGTNLSVLREENAPLSGGGKASGPLSFMKGFDAFAGVIKSGGRTRRAAKMVVLNADHPDIESFIWCKAKEEKKAHTLIEAGYDGSFEGEAYSSIAFQNANNSVRVTDEFMQAAVDNGRWALRSVVDGHTTRLLGARDLLRQIAEATHQCGDPGMQFDTTINRWNPVSVSGRFKSSNPCGEYNFLDDSACNLASINLLKFLKPNGDFDINGFTDAVDVMIRAQDILVDHASYPTEAIARNAHEYRPLGLGFANLGALLMTLGLPYDSDEGRSMAASIASLMTAQAYLTSSELARQRGAFSRFAENHEPFLAVIRQHQDAAALVPGPSYIAGEACYLWRTAYTQGQEYGFRNAQVTLVAPTGTIGFILDCSTTGIEPELALVKYKKLVGGGMMKLVNQSVAAALHRLGGFSSSEIGGIVTKITETGTIEGLIEKHYLPVFDCSLRAQNGTRSIHYTGHIRMMAAVQPFLSGAISKTINMPEDATVDDIMNAYIESWKQGLKAVAVYRDGSKGIQPLNTKKSEPVNDFGNTPAAQKDIDILAADHDEWLASHPRQSRRPLPEERRAVTRKFSIAGHEGYITVGLYENGTPGELFVTIAKEGSTISGLIDAFAIGISHCLQWGVPLEFLVAKYKNVRFEPSGWTGDPAIPYAKSIVDFIFRWMEKRFPKPEDAPPDAPPDVEWDTHLLNSPPPAPCLYAPKPAQSEAPVCSECGGLMVQTGSCMHCSNCDNSTGGCS